MKNRKSELSPRTLHNKLIQELIECALTCEDCATQCLNEDNPSLMAECIKLNRDCADICFQSARLLARGSDVAHTSLAVCEEICRLCAEECSKHEMEHCQICAAACNRCAEACHENHGGVVFPGN